MEQGFERQPKRDGVLQAWEKGVSCAVVFLLDTSFKATMISFWWMIFGTLFWQIRH